ncbi:MAG: DMT family transporter [Rhizobiaceae bacterium]|nr:DMT family transporter [Rhizobiaceae bacterium]
MTLNILLAILAGVLVGLSRQLNGKLSLSTSPLVASFWNHIVGFAALTIIGLSFGGLIPDGIANIPWFDYIGGPIGVIFVAAGSWLLVRIGAANTALLIVGGQMVSGVVMDWFMAESFTVAPSAIGVTLILAGMALMQMRTRN